MNRDPFFNPPTNIDFIHEDPERGLAIGVSRGGMPPSADVEDARSGLTVNIDPYHDQLGRFTTGPGMGGRHTASRELGARRMDYTQVTEIPSGTPASTPSGTPASTPSGTAASTPSGSPAKPASDTRKSAIETALSLFLVETQQDDTEHGKKKHGEKKHNANQVGIKLTHYGPGQDIGGWDPFSDGDTNTGVGIRGIKLTRHSLALSDDLVKAAKLVLGRPVYINGYYLGNYDDRNPKYRTIDIYDHDNIAGTYWGGRILGGTLSGEP